MRLVDQLGIDRYTTIGDLTLKIRSMLRHGNKVLSATLGVLCLYLVFSRGVGAVTFVTLSAGAVLAMVVWGGKGAGLPLMPMLAMQHLVAYGLPILVQHELVTASSAESLEAAGTELFVFLLALTGAWRVGMEAMHPSPPIAFTLTGIDKGGVVGLRRLGFGLVGAATSWLLLQGLDLVGFVYELLPSGSGPIIGAATSAMSACGFFLLSMILGSGEIGRSQRLTFWGLLIVNCLISASGFLLSGATTTIVAVIIGLFWSTGRLPWTFIYSVIIALSFLNIGKFTMRDRYWSVEDDQPSAPLHRLSEIPSYYGEWVLASYEALLAPPTDAPEAASRETIQGKESQSLLERVNNLQNLVFVIDAVNNGLPTLNGATYSLIPPLLLPRIMWPDKPRTHAGQILLNTHFGRQDLRATFTTYIAWGLLPEAYGNFGPITGAIILGVALGFFCAWAENMTARKPVLSAEGFISFVIFLGMASSYEMVASVTITSIFQSLVPVVFACMPFVHRQHVERPDPT